MKNTICKWILFSLTLLISHEGICQFYGGNGDGFSVAYANGLVSGSTFNFYVGGSGDGHDVRSHEAQLIAECILPNNLAVNDNSIPSNNYKAAFITSTGKVRDPNEVEFRAQNSITLRPNFLVEKDAYFHAWITACLSEPINF